MGCGRSVVGDLRPWATIRVSAPERPGSSSGRAATLLRRLPAGVAGPMATSGLWLGGQWRVDRARLEERIDRQHEATQSWSRANPYPGLAPATDGSVAGAVVLC